MIGYHISRDKLTCTTGKVFNSDQDWLEILLNYEPLEAKIFYDLDYSVAALLHHEGITAEQGKKLQDIHKLHLNSGYRLSYYPGKVFTIDYGYGAGRGYAYFYNAKQYIDVHHNLDSIWTTTDTYALIKADRAQKTGENILASYNTLGFTSQSLTSPIKAFEKSHLYPDIATVDDIPEEVGEFAYGSIKGNWVECYKLGSWNMAYDYDINGAYASELAKLLEIRDGHWIHSKSIPDNRNTAPYGFARGIISIDAPFHPFIVNTGDLSHTPTGRWETYLTLQEIDFLMVNRLGTFKIEDCWYWTLGSTTDIDRPFEAVVNELWAERQSQDAIKSLEADLTLRLIKRILAGMWGKMLELRGTEDNVEFGDRFNPVYGAIVEANSRLKVAQLCLDNHIIPLAVAVDGVVTDKPLKLASSNELGQWRLTHQGKCIIVSSGIVGIEGKGANEEFSISYDWLAETLGNKPGQSNYTMEKIAPVTLARALSTDGWDKLGSLVKSTRTIYIGGETKRCYIDEPECGDDILKNVYDSSPWDISMLGGQ